MGERKVLNKYFPPDFDPSIIPRRKRPKNQQIEVRMMLPFSMQCGTCGEYMYRGKKFNSKKEEVQGEDYHGIRIFRFYIKCITCSSEITFKTDPKNGDYVAEHGAQRNFEPWRETAAEEEAARKERVEEEKGDAMKALENRTLDSKREMDILDALDEIKAINQRHAKVDTDALLQHHAKRSTRDSEEQAAATELEQDRELARRVFEDKQKTLKRPLEPIEVPVPVEPPVKKTTASTEAKEKTPDATPTLPTIVVKWKSDTTGKKVKKAVAAPKKPVLTSLVAEYSDSD